MEEASEKRIEEAEGDKDQHPSECVAGSLEESQTAPDQLSGGILPELDEEVVETSDTTESLITGQAVECDDGACFTIVDCLSSSAGINTYSATTPDLPDLCDQCLLYESVSPEAEAVLSQLALLLREADYAMLPRRLRWTSKDSKCYLAVSQPAGTTLSDVFSDDTVPLVRKVNLIAQVAMGLVQMHERGWLHLALRANQIYVTKPIIISGLEYVTPVGQQPLRRAHFPGYSAIDLATDELPDCRTDIYSVGALLYHAAYGAPPDEQGLSLSTWTPPKAVPGVPQIIHNCLGLKDTRYPSAKHLHSQLIRLAAIMADRCSYELGMATTIGINPSRTLNEDACGYASWLQENEAKHSSWAVVCVADGMGGMDAGELASKTAVDTVLERASVELQDRLSSDEQAERTCQWLRIANERVRTSLEGIQARGGTTAVCASVQSDRLAIAHVGDSRAYLIRNGEIKQLTRDHSLVAALVSQGEISEEEARHHPDRNQITRSLGEKLAIPDYYIDSLASSGYERTLVLQDGDVILLCSDGFWEPVTEDQLLAIMGQPQSCLEEHTRGLVYQALENGSSDNVTVVALKIRKNSLYA